MKLNLRAILKIEPEGVKRAKALRDKSITDAVALPGGPSRDEMIYHPLWKGEDYVVGVGKPGKETQRKKPNPNDMWPYIKKEGAFDARSATFRDVFHELEHMESKSRYSLELLGCLLARSAFMLDHEMNSDKIVYVPPKKILEEISKDIPNVFGVPLEVFLQYLEAIALNEDVKYQTNLNSNGKPYNKSAGRPNNLLTCSHLIAVLLDRTSLVDFAYGFAQQRGVSALSPKKLTAYFPMLGSDSEEGKAISKEIGM